MRKTLRPAEQPNSQDNLGVNRSRSFFKRLLGGIARLLKIKKSEQSLLMNVVIVKTDGIAGPA
jgi:hypothetical protein